MLRLPPSIREAVLNRCLGLTLRFQPVSRWSTISPRARPVCVSILRWYATVHHEDASKLFSSQSNDNSPQPKTEDRSNGSGRLEAQVQVEPTAENPPKGLERILLTKLHKAARLEETNRDKREASREGRHLVTEAKATGPSITKGVHTPDAKATSSDEILPNPHYMQRHLDLPTKEQYPGANPELFTPTRVSSVLNSRCQQLRISLDTEVNFSEKRTQDAPLYTCDLKLRLAEAGEEDGTGEGRTKTAAKQAAYLLVLSKLHASGALKELWPDQEPETQYSISADGSHASSLLPANVRQQTMQEEKDAKAEIYNFAAGYNAVPHFHAESLQRRTPRARLGRQSKKPKPMVKVSIKLDELGISVSAVDNGLRAAEVAAALAFKRQAELLVKGGDAGIHQIPQAQSSALKTDTAKGFFDFYKAKGRSNIEIEYDPVAIAGTSQNTARLTINGEPVGQPVRMDSKKQAENVAYLIAAIDIIRTRPQLLQEFEQSLKKGKGKILRQLSSIDLDMDYDTLSVMRDALVEARRAGLPDGKEVLSAAELYAEERQHRRGRNALHADEVAAASARLLAKQRAFAEEPRLEELRSKKAGLPMNQYRRQVLELISENLYSIVVGATGSGKTTQVPQILLEEAIDVGKGGACNIICTQPRRIAATSIAQRVAVERGEVFQDSVGYQVRFDAKPPRQSGSITYCTTGILLEQLKHDPDHVFDSVSHLIIDEVHERDLFIDFLMIVVKKTIKTRQANGKSVPKVVLMSATLDTELFAQYFERTEDGRTITCPSVSVPGRTFPVQEKHLGSIMQELLVHRPREVKSLVHGDPKLKQYLQAETNFSAKQSGEASSASASVIDWKRERQSVAGQDDASIAAQEKEDALVPVSLMAATIAHICSTTEDGAILAFLPGLEEIIQTQRLLVQSRVFGVDFGESHKFRVCLLHSTVPKEQQSQIFEPLPPGCRRIILSTNIAETSVTVTDVKYVIDSGKLREKRYDQIRRITKLQCVWASKSNAKQRAGRAGRVQNGYYYAMYSKERHRSLRAVGLPELLRSDLQETALSIKAQRYGEPVASFLAQAIEPPPASAVTAAVDNLKALEAFTENEELTDVGRVLSKLPVHPSLGKMILLGIVFRCLDPMLVLGAAAEERSLFVTPPDRRSEARASHQSYVREQSDHIALLEAFRELRTLRDEDSMHAANRRAHEKFLHLGAFLSIDNTVRQIKQILVEAGLVPSVRDSVFASVEDHSPSLDEHSGNYNLIKALLLAGFHPNLAAKASSRGIVFRTPSETAVLMHPSSLNAVPMRGKLDERPHGTLFAYSTLSSSNDGNSLFMRDSTLVTPLMSALFGGKLEMSSYNRLEMNDWLPFFVKAYDRQYAVKLILEFRKALDRVLNGAFKSLADLDPKNPGQFAADPVREQFARRLVAVLDRSSELGERPFWVQQRASTWL